VTTKQSELLDIAAPLVAAIMFGRWTTARSLVDQLEAALKGLE